MKGIDHAKAVSERKSERKLMGFGLPNGGRTAIEESARGHVSRCRRRRLRVNSMRFLRRSTAGLIALLHQEVGGFREEHLPPLLQAEVEALIGDRPTKIGCGCTYVPIY